ncbi:uncharacterized protein KQ657_002569 [Scheffersomyces spartinae]|uniref:Phosphoglycerate mutase n=1 Tax=Scheffersomyces spartinae TaxID=45513 RepID=A0A9P7V5W4_9ASCO|nr:uncharacterized protein KQ657_002569 [Scheffersomyces spartinae]KAG7191963.1 hypothetical protein KQ657_002569 [Scheffersomyces spartinae]
MAKEICPRLIFVRHGQTEWSKSGQYTSITDLPLTPFGVRQMRATGQNLLGTKPNNLVQTPNLRYVISSPRTRARQTVELILETLTPEERAKIECRVDERIREWEYGDYEGLLTKQIIELRELRGLGSSWNIWANGCENGETYVDVTKRLDELIADIRKIHLKALEEEKSCDIIIVAHGHILRSLAARWVGYPVHCNPKYMLDAGGVGVLSYQHHNIEEPALQLAGAFVVPVEEEGKDI